MLPAPPPGLADIIASGRPVGLACCSAMNAAPTPAPWIVRGGMVTVVDTYRNQRPPPVV
jgi:hypothetical protein